MNTITICKVCAIMDNNIIPKECEWCELCSQFICKECKPNLIRRGMAMIKLKLKQNASTKI